MISSQKTFVVSLPRTGTTSICAFFLTQGLKVAHTAFTQEAFYQADVIADTPVFCDYKQLDNLFPGSKFIYIERAVDSWLPSMKTLLLKMNKAMADNSGGFSPVLRRCYKKTFIWQVDRFDVSDEVLTQCYWLHKNAVFDYFSGNESFFTYELGDSQSLKDLCAFLSIDVAEFPNLNSRGRINAWQQIRDTNKVDPNAFGAERRKFFGYI